jgi:DNA-binding response OmpR family regulator
VARAYKMLLVEDEPIIQFLRTDILDGIGVPVCGIASSVAAAVELIERGGFDGAILDCVLKDGTCDPVAEVLSATGIPFVIASGHPEQLIDERFPGVRRVAKPFMAGDLEQAIASMVREANREGAVSNDNRRAKASRRG